MEIDGYTYTHCDYCLREYYIPRDRPVLACNDCWEGIKEDIATEAARQAAASSRTPAGEKRMFRTLGDIIN